MQKFESFLRKKLLNEPSPVDVMAVWEAIQRKRKRRRLLLMLWWAGGCAATVLLGLWGWQQGAGHKLPKSGNLTEQSLSAPVGSTSEQAKTTNQLALVPDAFIVPDDRVGVPTVNSAALKMIDNLNHPKPNTPAWVGANIVSMPVPESEHSFKTLQKTLMASEVLPLASGIVTNLTTQVDSSAANVPFFDSFDSALSLLPSRTRGTLTSAAPDKSWNRYKSYSRRIEKDKLKIRRPARYLVLAGAGATLRNAPENQQWPGEVTPLMSWQANVSRHFYVQHGWFGEVGIQGQHWATRLRSSVQSSERLVVGTQSVISVEGQNLIVSSEPLLLNRTTTREVVQHHYANAVHLSLGLGKSWQQGRVSYQLATQLAGGTVWHRGQYLDDAMMLSPVSSTSQQRWAGSAQVYGQVNYHLNDAFALSARVNYWHYFTALDRGARYGLPGIQVGVCRRVR
jgi:hypothetical protein